MTPADQRPYASRFAIRFAVILAVAMLPAGIIAFIQTKALEDEIQTRREVSLMGATLRAAAAQTSFIDRVRGVVSSLAVAVPNLIDDPAACDALMLQVAKLEPLASVVAFVPIDGKMTCSSVGRDHDYGDDPLFQSVRDVEAPYFWVNPYGPIAKTSVLGISHPVYNAAGVYLGYAVVAVPHNKIDEMEFTQLRAADQFESPGVFWTFDREGRILTSNLDLELAKKQLPTNRALKEIVGTDRSIFQSGSLDGKVMTYAVVPIVSGELYLMGSFVTETPIVGYSRGLAVYLPTLLMWLVGLIVSIIAAEMLVTRHVRTLNRSIVSFARGDRRLQSLDLKNAPAELDELASAYVAMTDSIMRSEAELEDSVHQKEVLLREVHHRVKNNLQLISSIMNIQIRSARSGEAKDLLKNLQERIMSLATVHRGLYQTSGLADVRARELIPDIVRQIMSMSSGPEKPFVTHNEIDDLRLVPDQAVPLSLMLAEALTNAIKHAGASRDYPGRLTVRLKRSGGSDAVLEVVNSKRDRFPNAPAAAASDTGIGSQLITAFVQQLGGKQESGEADGDYYLRVTFNVSPLAMAEDRQAPQDDTAGWNASVS